MAEDRSTKVDQRSPDSQETPGTKGPKIELFERLPSEFARQFKLKHTHPMVAWLIHRIQRIKDEILEELVAKTQQDSKTKLWNFETFLERLEKFLAEEELARWCAVGVVDITSFKWYNDNLGHTVGDKIIERIADILREKVRSTGLLTRERRGKVQDRRTQARAMEPDRRLVHSRFGGDEFCFLIPDLPEYHYAKPIGNRFREAVTQYDWTVVDPKLAAKPPSVDVGVVCLQLGPLAERRSIARRLRTVLFEHADRLMYDAKQKRADQILLSRVKLVNGELVEISDDDILKLKD